MGTWDREQIRSANDGLRATLDSIEGDFERELGELGEVQRKLAALQVRATTPNNLGEGDGQRGRGGHRDHDRRRRVPADYPTAVERGPQRGDPGRCGRGDAGAGEDSRAAQSVVDRMADLDEIMPGMPKYARIARAIFGEPAAAGAVDILCCRKIGGTGTGADPSKWGTEPMTEECGRG